MQFTFPFPVVSGGQLELHDQIRARESYDRPHHPSSNSNGCCTFANTVISPPMRPSLARTLSAHKRLGQSIVPITRHHAEYKEAYHCLSSSAWLGNECLPRVHLSFEAGLSLATFQLQLQSGPSGPWQKRGVCSFSAYAAPSLRTSGCLLMSASSQGLRIPSRRSWTRRPQRRAQLGQERVHSNFNPQQSGQESPRKILHAQGHQTETENRKLSFDRNATDVL